MSLLILPRHFRKTEIDLKKEAGIELLTTISAKYQVAVCRNGHVVRKPFGNKWIPNVITNVGLDQLMQNNFFYQFVNTAARLGSGTTTPAVTDTALTTPLKGSNTQFTGGGSGTTIGTTNDTVNGAATHTNVFEFSSESGSVTYNEVGLASSVGPTGGSLYTHSLFPSALNLVNGDNVRLTYSITFSIPATVTPITVSLSAINGFNASGQLKVIGTFQSIFANLISSGGISGGNDAYFRCAYSGGAYGNLITAPSAFPSVNTGQVLTVAGTNAALNLATYTAGSFTRTGQVVFIPSNPSTTTSGITGVTIGPGGGASSNGYLMLLFTATQTKANTNTLTLNYSSSIARA